MGFGEQQKTLIFHEQAGANDRFGLKRMGCRNFGDDNNHSKCVISENDGILFTANIDGKNGMLNGFEAGCRLSREQISLAFQHINKLIENSKKARYE